MGSKDTGVLRAPFVSWLMRCGQDHMLRRDAAGLDVVVALKAASLEAGIRFNAGQVSTWLGPVDGPDIQIVASADAWERLLTSETIAPGWHSFGAIIRLNPAFDVSGDPLVLAQSLPALERAFQLAVPMVEATPAEPVERDPGLCVGRYVQLPGFAERSGALIFWEESGAGAPLLMLHTAGADARQYRYQLWDVDLARSFHMYAFDMPGHGRSGLPRGWLDGEAYRLTSADYLDVCVAFIEKVICRPCIVMGCSMGAAMSLLLAARRPDLVAGVLALEAPWRAPGRRNEFLANARVSDGLHNAAYVTALLSPYSPFRQRAEAGWISSQGAPGIYTGDLYFYSEEFDGEIVGQELAKTQVPVHLLTGDFDYSASPENTRRLAGLIPGCVFKTMSGLGHFPMIEHPDHFRTMMIPELWAIRERATNALRE